MFFRLALLLIFNLIAANFAYGSGGLTCSDWVSGPGLTVSNEKTQLGDSIKISKDSNGTVTQACRDAAFANRVFKGFPTVFQRMKLIRMGTIFSPVYRVHEQYCPFRDCIFDNCECSICTGFSFTTFRCTRHKELWVNTGSYDPNSGANTMCLESYHPGAELPFGNGRHNDTNLRMVCAYVGGKNVHGTCLAPIITNLIGCVQEPPKPGPPVYNTSIVSEAFPVVDNKGSSDPATILNKYIAEGSKFDRPLINLKLTNPLTLESSYLPLRYYFPGYNGAVDYPQCGTFSSLSSNGVSFKFCAQVPSYNEAEVCACTQIFAGGTKKQDFCASGVYMGCVPRPNLKQSNYALIVDNISEFTNNISGITQDYLYKDNYSRTYIPLAQISIVNVDGAGRPKLYDAGGDRVYKKISDRKYYKYDKKFNETNNLAKLPIITTQGNYCFGAATRVNDPNIITGATVSNTNSKFDGLRIGCLFEYKTNYDNSGGQNMSPYLTNPYSPMGYSRDIATVFGVDFLAIMPQFDNTTHQPLIEELATPTGRSNIDYCNVYSSQYSVTTNQWSQLQSAKQSFYIPAGTRWRSACRGRQAADNSVYVNNNYNTGPYPSLGCFYNGNAPAPNPPANYIENGGYRDCVPATQPLGCDPSGKNCKIQIGKMFLKLIGDPNNKSLNCCSGSISNDFNIYKASNQCQNISTHDNYAEGIACPGVYTTDVYNDTSTNKSAYGKATSKNLTIIEQGKSNTPEQVALSINNNHMPIINPSLPQAIIKELDPTTATKQASSICVYPSSGNIAWGAGGPLGYNLNSGSDEDPYQLNAYLCDHIPQMCNSVITPTANSGHATWPRVNDKVIANGKCESGYSTNNSKPPLLKCNDGVWNQNSQGVFKVSNPCIKNCGAVPTNINSSFSQVGTSTKNNTTYTGVCKLGYMTQGNTSPTLTCSNSKWTVQNDCNTIPPCNIDDLKDSSGNSPILFSFIKHFGSHYNSNMGFKGLGPDMPSNWITPHIINTMKANNPSYILDGTTKLVPDGTILYGVCNVIKGYFGQCILGRCTTNYTAGSGVDDVGTYYDWGDCYETTWYSPNYSYTVVGSPGNGGANYILQKHACGGGNGTPTNCCTSNKSELSKQIAAAKIAAAKIGVGPIDAGHDCVGQGPNGNLTSYKCSQGKWIWQSGAQCGNAPCVNLKGYTFALQTYSNPLVPSRVNVLVPHAYDNGNDIRYFCSNGYLSANNKGNGHCWAH